MRLKKVSVFLVILILLVVAVSAFAADAKYYCPMHPHYTSDKPGDCPICQMRLVPVPKETISPKKTAPKKILFYRNPMRPDVTSPVPAKDEMGMDYIPVLEEAVSSDPKEICVIHECPMLKKGQPCPMLIIAEKGEKLECPVCKARIEAAGEMVSGPLPAGYATVLISPQKQQLIGIKTGVVERKNTQKTIRAVGRIAYDPELYQAQAEYLQSFKSSSSGEWAKKMLESAKVKLVRMGFGESLLADLEKQEGPDKSLLYGIPDGPAWVYANIYEYELPLVKAGDSIRVETTSDPGHVMEGVVKAIDPTVDAATRTVRVRALVKNEKGMFKPDMYVNLSLSASLGEVMTVPTEAVFFTGAVNIVFVDRGNGMFEPREIVLGQRVEDSYEVKKGLKEGERVVTNGNFLVDSESRLKAALSGFGK